MKLHLLALIILLGGTLAAQDDVSNEDQSAYEMKLGKADALRDEIGQARASGDVEREITRSMELVFYLMNDLGDRVESYERALALEDLLDQHRDTEVYQRIAPRLYFELGYFLQDQNDFASGRDYMIRSIELGEEYGMDRKTMDWRLHLSAVYMNLDNRDASLELLDRVAAQAALLNDPVAVERAHEFRMCFHLHYDELDEARTYGLLSLGEYNPSNQLAFRNGILSEIYYKLGQNDSAAVFAERALEISVENGWIREEQEAHKHLRIIYKNLGDFERSVYHHERYDELQSELRSFETARAIGLANAQKVETERKLQEELASQQLASQRFIILLIAIGLAVLICVVIYIANRLQVIRNQKAEIEREKLRAERSERAKEQFLANMSHEIRTPMNAISGMISSLLRREHSDEQRVFLRAMKQSAANLLVILNDILDMSKLSYGSLDITSVPVNLAGVCHHVVSLLQQKAREKGISLSFQAPEDFPEFIMGDPVRMNQILINLIGNAIKFTEEGQVALTLDWSKDTYTLKVRDTGVGIAPETLPVIFEQFRQGEGPVDKRYAGTGLGLAITRQLVELQQGKIWVESEPGQGSTFSIALPLIPASQTTGPDSTISEERLKEISSQLGIRSILIAEDNALNKMVIEDDLGWFFPDAGLVFAESGKEAIALFDRHSFDVVLMDIQMPEMNGYEATRAIRQLESAGSAHRRTPVIAMTASLLKDQLDKCFEVGMDAYIPKPYTPRELVITIAEARGFSGVARPGQSSVPGMARKQSE